MVGPYDSLINDWTLTIKSVCYRPSARTNNQRQYFPFRPLKILANRKRTLTECGLAMWSRLLTLALLLLPASALADVKEKVAALAPSGVVLVVDLEGSELVAQNVDESFIPASVTKIVTALLALEVLGGD